MTAVSQKSRLIYDDFSAKDFDDDTALIVDDQVQADGDGPADDDLAQFTIKKIPNSFPSGSVQIELSDPSAVRLFDDNGTELTQRSLSLANPSGYLSSLTSGDVDVWLEGLHKNSDFVFTVIYKDQYGREVKRQSVHMLLAEWTFIDPAGNLVQDVKDADKQSLLDRYSGDPGATLFDDSFFKSRIDGLPSELVLDLTYTSDDGDTFTDDLIMNGPATEFADFAAMYYSDQDYTTAEKLALKQSLQVNTVHNQTTKVAATLPHDAFDKNIGVRPSVDFLDSQNRPMDPKTEALNVSNFVTGESLFDATPFNRKMQDPDLFRLQVVDPKTPNTVTVKLQSQDPEGQDPDRSYTYTLTEREGDVYRSNIFLDLVSDTADDSSWAHGHTGDPQNQTVLVKLGDVVTLSYDRDSGLPEAKEQLSLGRPSSEDDNGTNQLKNDIRVVRLNIIVLAGVNVSSSNIFADIDTANERFAQSTIQVVAPSIESNAQSGSLTDADGYTIDDGNPAISNDENSVLSLVDNDPNTIDVIYVRKITHPTDPNKVINGKALIQSRNNTGNPKFQNILLISEARNGAPLTLPHEMMHVLLNSGKHVDDARALLRGNGTSTDKAWDASKRIGPYREDDDRPGHAGDTILLYAGDTQDLRAHAESLP